MFTCNHYEYASIHFYFSVELDCLSEFGKVGELLTHRAPKPLFYKPEPTTLAEDNTYLKRAGVTLDEYTAKFLNITTTSQIVLDNCLANHPHAELLAGLISDNDTTAEETQTSD